MIKSSQNKLLLGLSILLCQLACKSDKIKYNSIVIKEEAAKIDTLKGHPVAGIDSAEISSIGIIDTVLVVVTPHTDAYLNFYALSDLKFLGKYGTSGDSSYQFMNPRYDNQYYVKDNETYFYLTDYRKNLYLKFNLRKVLGDTIVRPEWTVRLPPYLISGYASLLGWRDSLIYGSSISSRYKGRFFVYDIKKRKTSWIKNFSKVDSVDIPANAEAYYYYAQNALNMKKGIMASAMALFKRVDFFMLDSNKIQTSIFESAAKSPIPVVKPGNEMLPYAETRAYYITTYSGNNYFYALCLNKEYANYFQENTAMELHVFSWDGQLKKVYYLNQSYLGFFAVDEMRHRLYAIKYRNENKPAVVVYDLPADINY
ncbi:hypothetical protein [Chitinophaga sancti]|uniref:TolB-like 6-blade propeller-like n=1 Tax=Chitinophaga sancti TaxID=1004 RepID=A0A1K1QQJ4_9BACT|nr:hypothetical protein [Chitinophaga sancti]WQD65060.1 hypothetical protein U0033_11705 [Chitinophaga sancti]WQG89316.1 hypothetical protein SR876_30765 [Chitinophaga sancti]SFW61550.1 hypothetical protein SAMN05661012_02976 [Chitinophaga sancti]